MHHIKAPGGHLEGSRDIAPFSLWHLLSSPTPAPKLVVASITVHTVSPSMQREREREVDPCVFEASMTYIVSPRPARATEKERPSGFFGFCF